MGEKENRKSLQLKRYPKEQHGLSVDQIDEDALYVISTLQARGFTSYLVGGSIRDLLLGHKPKDFDISTSAKPEEIKNVFRGRCILIGRRFRLAHVRFKDKIIEVSTFRSGSDQEDSLIIHDNTWGSEEEDVLRRDFKINGLLFDPSTETVIDYVGGFEDTQNRLLEVIGDPFVRFKQDPVRMLRMLKFLARFDLRIDEKTKFAFTQVKEDILKSSQARILEEVLRMLHSSASEKFFRLMLEYGILDLLLPEVARFITSQKDEKIFSFLREIDHMILKMPGIAIDRSILIACLLYPIIDANIQNLTSSEGRPPHLGIIQTVVKSHIDTSFRGFFQLSRKIKTDMHFLICWQYRLTPLVKTAKVHYRAPQTPAFLIALKFLNLRARLDPTLLEPWNLWRQSYDMHKGLFTKQAPVKRRRYKRSKGRR